MDEGDLDRIVHDPSFTPKRRITHSEELVNKAIFRASEEEAKYGEGILEAERGDMSTCVSGGAG